MFFVALLGCKESVDTIYVSSSGNDQNNGTISNPVATIQKAQQLAREIIKKDSDAKIQVILSAGDFYIDETIQLNESDIISEPHMKLNEGGAVYAYSIGKGNKWIDNIAFKSSGMPASSIYALDDLAEFVTVQNNIYWINGKILNGVGSRPSERGNIISGNIRVNYREEFKSLMGEDKVGSWYVHETGRTSLDQKLKKIENEVKILGGWPKYSVIGIPESENGLPRLDEQYVLPKGTHVTIE